MNASRLLLCCATRIEAMAVAHGAQQRATILCTGVGPKCAGEALERYLLSIKDTLHWPKQIVSTGFAGTIDPTLPLGAWVQGQQIGSPKGDAIYSVAVPPFVIDRTADFITLNTVHLHGPLPTPGGAPQPNEYTASCVDMESYVLARIAYKYNIPFSIVRLISDTPAAPLPRGFTVTGLAFLKLFLQKPLTHFRFLLLGTRLTYVLATGWARFLTEESRPNTVITHVTH